MRVAIIHDYLNQYGGAERVLESFCELFPDAPIYTLFYDEEKTLGRFKGKKIITSFLDHKYVINNHRLFIPLMPLAVSLMKVDDDYDVVLSSSAGFGKGIRYGKNTIHISYCHTPLRYAWEHYKYFNWPTYLKILSAPAFWYLRIWDKWVSQKPQKLIANSKYIAEKIKNYYKREAEVIYPPVDTEKFFIKKGVRKGDYFLAVGRLMHYKRFDLIIQAFNKLNLPLLIIGTGPELENLKQLVKSSKIEFLTSITDEQLVILYNGAQAFIFPQVEDFGLVAAEAQACGTPVIALNQGGGREIVENGKTG
ncbi:MAG: glycosyltransferase, partial [Patescibacteria group bacterium]